MNLRSWAAVFAVAGLSCALVTGESVAQDRTTVCDLARTPKKYISHRVEVSGDVVGGVELILRDRSCPRTAIGISIFEASGEPDVVPLWSAIYREGYIGTADKSITATLIGTYRYDRGAWPGGVLDVEHVHNLKVKLDNAGRR